MRANNELDRNGWRVFKAPDKSGWHYAPNHRRADPWQWSRKYASRLDATMACCRYWRGDGRAKH